MMTSTRIARDLSAAVVAGIAAVASYTHMRDLATTHGQTDLIGALVPVSVDGMLVVSTVAMADDKATGRRVRPSAYLAFAVGVAASIVANVLAAPPDVVSRCVSAWPSVALVLVVEVLARPGHPDTAASADAARVRSSADGQVRTSPNGLARTRPRTGGRTSAGERLARARAANPDMSVGQLAKAARVSERHARRLLAAQPTTP